jgi:hypothetical protein
MQHLARRCIERVMKRLAVLSALSLLSSLPACSGGIGWPKSASTASASSSAGSLPNEPPAAGLSEYATRFIRDTTALSQSCPAGPKPAPDYESECVWRADAAERLHKSVEEKSHPQVARGHAYLGEFRKSLTAWRGAAKDDDARKTAAYHNDRETGSAAHTAKNLIEHLKSARDGKILSLLTSLEHRDADYVERHLQMLRREMTSLETVAKGCAGGAGDKELCDIAVNREKYFAAMKPLQFDAIIADRMKEWTGAVEFMKNEGKASVQQYNTLLKPEKLKELGEELAAIGKVLDQANPAAKIDGKLTKVRDEFLAAVRAKHNTNAWAAHAAGARFQDPIVTQAVKDISGLSLVRVGANVATWEVIRGALDQPVQRNRGIWALMKKPGDAFCRLYQFTVVQEHLGGGKYGAGRAESFGEVLFWVSSCK